MISTTITAPSTPAADNAARTLYTLPDFNQALEQTLTDCLRLDHRGLAFDYASARLVCRERRIEPATTATISSYPLLASLTGHFTGHFQWQNVESAGLYTTDFPAADTPSIGALDRDALTALYAAVALKLPACYKQMLSDNWAEIQPSGKTRRDDFLADRVQLLRLEGQIRVEQGQFSAQLYAMLSDALEFGMDTSANPVQKHDVFGLSLGTNAGATYQLTGVFVITDPRSDQIPATDDESLGEVMLYTPTDSLERFDSLKQLTDTLNRRLADGTRRQRLLRHLKHDDVVALALPPVETVQPAIQWQLARLGNNFMSLLLTSQIIKQKADFDHAVSIAQRLRMNQDSFDTLIIEVMASEQLFDNHRIERQLDCEVIREQMPDWWQKMSEDQHVEWTRHATAYAQAIRTIRRISLDHFNAPQADSAHVIAAYVDGTVTAALAEKNIPLAPGRIRVMATLRMEVPSGFDPLSLTQAQVESETFSLQQIAHDEALRTKVLNATELMAADEHGVAIPGLSGAFVKELLARIEIPKRLDDYLAEHLDDSPFATELKHQHRELLLARLGMAYMESQRNGFPASRLRWIKAVLDSPAARIRMAADEDLIEVRMLHINNIKIPDIMLIAPTGKFDRGPLVLCTLNAPDSHVFRAYDSMFHLKQGFLEHPAHKSYIAGLLPSADGGLGRLMLDYSEWLKHWRLPDMLTSLPGPVPVPSQVMNPVVFNMQTEDVFDEHYGIRTRQLKVDAKARFLKPGSGNAGTGTLDIVMGIALMLLPEPVMIPLALGMGLGHAWSGFHKVDENDWTAPRRSSWMPPAICSPPASVARVLRR